MTPHTFYRLVMQASGEESLETAKRATAAVFHALAKPYRWAFAYR
jgi:hypothetical protein